MAPPLSTWATPSFAPPASVDSDAPLTAPSPVVGPSSSAFSPPPQAAASDALAPTPRAAPNLMKLPREKRSSAKTPSFAIFAARLAAHRVYTRHRRLRFVRLPPYA